MASHQDFVDYVAEQLREAGSIRSRKMFGEYRLFCDGVFFAVICDDQLFIKITPAGEAAFPHLPKAPPYEGAGDYIWVEDVDDRDTMTALTRLTCLALQDQPKKRRKGLWPLTIRKSTKSSTCRPGRRTSSRCLL